MFNRSYVKIQGQKVRNDLINIALMGQSAKKVDHEFRPSKYSFVLTESDIKLSKSEFTQGKAVNAIAHEIQNNYLNDKTGKPYSITSISTALRDAINR